MRNSKKQKSRVEENLSPLYNPQNCYHSHFHVSSSLPPLLEHLLTSQINEILLSAIQKIADHIDMNHLTRDQAFMLLDQSLAKHDEYNRILKFSQLRNNNAY